MPEAARSKEDIAYKAAFAVPHHQPLVSTETSIADIHSDAKAAVVRPKATGF
jgi:hypothetical protein